MNEPSRSEDAVFTAAEAEGESFELFFVETYPQAKRLASRIVPGAAGAEDVAAEALARAYVRWKSIGRLPHRRAWVLRVTANLAIDSARQRRHIWIPGRATVDSDDTSADRVALSNALAKLPRRQRQVVTLRYLLDMSEVEVAEILGVARGTVSATASQGLSAMRAALGRSFGAAAITPTSHAAQQDTTPAL